MTTTPEIAIRLRRAQFNRALAEADLAAIGPLLSLDALLVTGTDSAILSGRKAQLLAWRREFAAADRTVYTRTPGAITVSPVEPIALEQGEWQAVSSRHDSITSSGLYSAKWRELRNEWVIEAEIYVTLA